ncbi:MAG TPA: hypothetical protein VF849_01590, partial [Blattabacteriaceae bacterium]
MSFTSAYNKSASRDIELEVKEDNLTEQLKKEEFEKWLRLPFTQELILFLGKRELTLLNNARNSAKANLQSENIAKNLLKAVGYREVIEFLTTNKHPIDIE